MLQRKKLALAALETRASRIDIRGVAGAASAWPAASKGPMTMARLNGLNWLSQRLLQGRKRRKLLSELRRLDAHELNDLGIGPADFHAIAAGTYRRESSR